VIAILKILLIIFFYLLHWILHVQKKHSVKFYQLVVVFEFITRAWRMTLIVKVKFEFLKVLVYALALLHSKCALSVVMLSTGLVHQFCLAVLMCSYIILCYDVCPVGRTSIENCSFPNQSSIRIVCSKIWTNLANTSPPILSDSSL